MTLTPEIILAAIGLFGTILGIPATIIGAWAINSRVKTKADADARIKDAEARLKAVETEAEAQRAEDTRAQVMLDMFKQQYQTNQQLAEFVKEEANRRESNYNTLRRLIDEIQRYLGNLITGSNDLLTKEIRDIPNRVGVVNNDGITALVQQLGTVITSEFAMQRAERTMHPWPESEDSEWRDAFIVPTSDDVQLRKQPAFDDDARLHKPCAAIKAEGEVVRLIQGRLKGWLIVDKIEDDQRCWGWLPEYAVTVGQPEATTETA